MLIVDALGITRIDPAHDLVDETAIEIQILEVVRPTHDQRVGNRPLQMAMRALDRPVLMGHTFGVARWRHAVGTA